MIEVKDRIPTYPGRVKLIPVSGQANTYDLVRADQPIEAGTPINRALFQSILDEMSAIQQQVNNKLFEISQRVRIADVVIGTEIGLYENGVLVPFIKLNSGGLVIRKNCVTEGSFSDPGETYYANSRIDRWLNNEYIAMLDQATQSVIPLTSFEVSSLYGVGSLSRRVFLPSLYEYSITSTQGVVLEGAPYSYFTTKEQRIALLNGVPTNHWTRSTTTPGNEAAYITATGDHKLGSPSSTIAGIRPAFTLPANFEVTVGVPSQENVMATAEVI